MGSTFRFLAVGTEADQVLEWFAGISPPPVEERTERGLVLWFDSMGPLSFTHDGFVDPRLSPLVTYFPPTLRRQVLWTAGEVHFAATPLRSRFPELHRIAKRFQKWLSGSERVFRRGAAPGDWDYFLEGSLKSRDSDIFALPDAAQALRAGQYFIAEEDNAEIIRKLCGTLRLRGIECGPADSSAPLPRTIVIRR
jgi:hypothetical protein